MNSATHNEQIEKLYRIRESAKLDLKLANTDMKAVAAMNRIAKTEAQIKRAIALRAI